MDAIHARRRGRGRDRGALPGLALAAAGVALGGAALAGGGRAPAPGAAAPALRAGNPVQLHSPGENTKPCLGIRPGGGVYLAWAQTQGERTAAWMSRSRDGVTFDPPVRLSAPGMDLDLGAENGPVVAVGPDRAVYAVWVAGSWAASRPRPAPRPTAGGGTAGHGGGAPPRPGNLNVYLARSTDDGATFSKAVRVNDDADGAEHRFPTVAVEASGAVDVVWLDKRKQTVQRPDFARVFFARSIDGGRTFAANADATSGQQHPICHCCKPGLAIHPQGGLRIGYRNDIGDVRDMFLVGSVDGGASFTPPAPLEQTGWKIPFCPMNGPTLAFDAAGDLHAVWMTGGSVTGTPLLADASGPQKVLYRRLSTRTAASEPPLFVACGQHPHLAVSERGEAFVAWKGADSVQLARLPRDARGPATVRLTAGPGAADFPSLAMSQDGVLFAAWQQTDGAGARQIVVTRVVQGAG
jgi:hypothetical protein